MRLSKITLTKQAPAVSLTKQGSTGGAMRVNLKWSMRGLEKRGLFGKRKAAQLPDIDLDLCAFWEMADGSIGHVTPVGNRFGSLTERPYVQLDRDDRTGGSDGENLTINLDHADKIKRILIFADIYDGADSWQGLDAVATLYPQQGPPIEMRLDECTVNSRVVALALIENVGGEILVRREAKYIVVVPPVRFKQEALDIAYNWGMSWEPAKPKD